MLIKNKNNFGKNIKLLILWHKYFKEGHSESYGNSAFIFLGAAITYLRKSSETGFYCVTLTDLGSFVCLGSTETRGRC